MCDPNNSKGKSYVELKKLVNSLMKTKTEHSAHTYQAMVLKNIKEIHFIILSKYEVLILKKLASNETKTFQTIIPTPTS